MRPLVINADVRARIARVKAYAEAHPIPLWRIRRIVERKEIMPASFDPGFSTGIPFGFGVTFTIEEHIREWMYHLSVCLPDAGGRMPNPAAIEAIMQLFGIETPLRDAHLYVTEKNRPDGVGSANVLAPAPPPHAAAEAAGGGSEEGLRGSTQ
jgi:hypothetical protein